MRAAASWLLILAAGVLAGIASLLAGPLVMLLSAVMALLLARTHGEFGVGAYLTGLGMALLLLLGPQAEAAPGGVIAAFVVVGGCLTAAGAMLTVLGRRSGHPQPGP